MNNNVKRLYIREYNNILKSTFKNSALRCRRNFTPYICTLCYNLFLLLLFFSSLNLLQCVGHKKVYFIRKQIIPLCVCVRLRVRECRYSLRTILKN